MTQSGNDMNQGMLIDADGQWRPEVMQRVTERAWELLKEELRIEAERQRAGKLKPTRRRGGR